MNWQTAARFIDSVFFLIGCPWCKANRIQMTKITFLAPFFAHFWKPFMVWLRSGTASCFCMLFHSCQQCLKSQNHQSKVMPQHTIYVSAKVCQWRTGCVWMSSLWKTHSQCNAIPPSDLFLQCNALPMSSLFLQCNALSLSSLLTIRCSSSE